MIYAKTSILFPVTVGGAGRAPCVAHSRRSFVVTTFEFAHSVGRWASSRRRAATMRCCRTPESLAKSAIAVVRKVVAADRLSGDGTYVDLGGR